MRVLAVEDMSDGATIHLQANSTYTWSNITGTFKSNLQHFIENIILFMFVAILAAVL